MTVAQLLEQARQAHTRYRDHAGKVKEGRTVQAPQLTVCGQAVQEALTTRMTAEGLDPTHQDPAWIHDAQAMKGQTNEALMAFYAKYLTANY